MIFKNNFLILTTTMEIERNAFIEEMANQLAQDLQVDEKKVLGSLRKIFFKPKKPTDTFAKDVIGYIRSMWLD